MTGSSAWEVGAGALELGLALIWARGGRVPGVLGHSAAGVVGVMGAHLGAHSPRVRGPSLASIV